MSDETRADVSESFSASKNLEIINSNSRSVLSTDIMLQKTFTSENGLTQNYHGRELFELLQNADDAFTALKKDGGIDIDPQSECEVLLELKEDDGKQVLRVSNHGKPFNAKTVLSLCRGHASNKSNLFIGNKGIGFRSVLNWADVVRVYSGKYNLEFSEENANAELEKIKSFPNVESLLKENEKLGYPILWAPKEVPSKKEEGYDTTIELVIKDGSQSDAWSLNKQVEEFDECVLLFIQSVNKITFRFPDKCFSYVKSKPNTGTDENTVSVCKLDESGTIVGEEKKYFVFRSDDEELAWEKGKMYKVPMVVAIPSDFSPLNKKMYTFFPIANAPCPFNALMHTSFLLSDTRDSIKNDTINMLVFAKLLNFYVKSVCEFFCKSEYENKIIELLTPKEEIWKKRVFANPFERGEIEGKKFFEYYISLLKASVKFFTVNEKFIGMENARKYGKFRPILNLNYPSNFIGDGFDGLIKKIDNDDVVEFITSNLLVYPHPKDDEIIYDYQYMPGEVKEKINGRSCLWSPSDNVETFLWWMENFGDPEKPEQRGFPQVLKKRKIKEDEGDVKWIERGIFFLPPRATYTKMPDFAQCSFLDPEYADALVSVCERKFGPGGDRSSWNEDAFNDSKLSKESKHDYKDFCSHEDRVVIDFLQNKMNCKNDKYVKIVEYSVSNLLSPINSSVKIDGDAEKSFANALEFAKWLRNNIDEIKSNEAWFNLASENNVSSTYMPCRNGGVEQIKNLYVGSEYGNQFGENLFARTGRKAVVAAEKLFINEDDTVQDVLEFLKMFKVDEIPQIRKTSLDLSKVDGDYAKYLKALIEEDSKKIESRNPITSSELSRVEVPYVDGIENILQACDMADILRWIVASDKLKKVLNGKDDEQQIQYKVHTEGKGKPPSADPIKNFKGYLNYLFENKKWLQINGRKECVKNCILHADSHLADVLNIISDKELRDICDKVSCNREELENLFIQLGVAQNYVDLPVEKFYRMMLRLPSIDPDGKLSSSIYSACIKSLTSSKEALTKFEGYHAERVHFLTAGKLVAKQTSSKKGTLSYQPVSNVYFTNRAVPNISGKYLLNVPLKNGSIDDMKLLFGVKPFEESFSIDVEKDKELSDWDSDFQKEFIAYKPYAYSLRVENAAPSEQSLFRRLEVHLVKSLYIIDESGESKPFVGDEYTLFNVPGHPYLWYIYLGDLKYDDFELSKKMEDIFEVVCILQDRAILSRFRELFGNKNGRNQLIEYYGIAQETLDECRHFLKMCDDEKNKVIRYLENAGFDKLDEAREKLQTVFLGKTDNEEEQLLLLDFIEFVDLDETKLSEIIGVDIDLQLAYKKRLERAYTKQVDLMFGYHLYNKYKENGQDQFLSEWRKVKYKVKDYEGKMDRSFSPDNYIESVFKDAIGKDMDRTETIADVNEFFSKNYMLLKGNVEKTDYLSDFLTEKNKSRLFYAWEPLKAEFDQYIQKKDEEDRSSGAGAAAGGDTDDFDEPVLKAPKERKGKQGGNGGGHHPRGSVSESDGKNKRKIGDAAELFVFNQLTKHKIKQIEEWVGGDFEIEWISGAAERCDHVTAEITDDAGYDMRLIDKKNDEYYIEVKGSSGTLCEFYMSQNEIEFANDMIPKNRYKLIFVSNVKKGKKGINILNPKDSMFGSEPCDTHFYYKGEKEN